MVRLSVVIAVRDGARPLARCLQTLAGQRDELHEVIVVDDGPADDCAAVARAAGCVLHQMAVTPGICRARNSGARQASGDVLGFLDADTIVQPGWARALRRAFGAGAELVGGGILIPAPRSLAERYRAGRDEHDQQSRNGFLPFAAGANLAIRADVFAALGGFDELLPGAEDVDLSFRAQLAGYRLVFVPEAAVIHPPRHTVHAMLRQHLRNSRNRRLADAKYAAFPYQRMHRRDPFRVLRASLARQLVEREHLAPHELALPFVDSAMAAVRRAGAARADLELMAGLQPRPRPLEPSGHEQRNIASGLPERPRFLLVGEDGAVARLLRLALDAGPEISIPPPGLEAEALAAWDTPAPWSLRLARRAGAIGWSIPQRLTALRLERERPRTWGEALLVLHGIRAWLHERHGFAIAAQGPAGTVLASRLADVPVVVAGDGPSLNGRALLRVTRRDLVRNRRAAFRELSQALELTGIEVVPVR